MRMRNVILTLVLALSLGLTACEFGQVEQGRCVAFNPETKTLLVVLDVNHDQLNPHYSGGVHEYTLPADPSEIGPALRTGICVFRLSPAEGAKRARPVPH